MEFQLTNVPVDLASVPIISLDEQNNIRQTFDAAFNKKVQDNNGSEHAGSAEVHMSVAEDEAVPQFLVPKPPLKRRINENSTKTAARTVPYAKIRRIHSDQPSQANATIQEHVLRNGCPAVESNFTNRTLASINPVLQLYPSTPFGTLYKVVFRGKANQHLLVKEMGTAASGMQNKSQQPSQDKQLRSIQLGNPPTKNSALTKARRPSANYILHTSGVTTRSGRLSKPAKTLISSYECSVKPTADEQQTDENEKGSDIFPAKLPDAEENKENSDKEQPGQDPNRTRRKPTIGSQHRCGTCNKIYLGHRMKRHLRKYPEHVTLYSMENRGKNPEAKESSPVLLPLESQNGVTDPTTKHSPPILPAMTAGKDPTSVAFPVTPKQSGQLYRMLLRLVKSGETESQQRDILLREISQFVQLLRSRVPSLIVPSEKEDNDTVFVEQNVADVLRLNRGTYRFCMAAFLQQQEKLLQSPGAGAENATMERNGSNISEAGSNVFAGNATATIVARAATDVADEDAPAECNNLGSLSFEVDPLLQGSMNSPAFRAVFESLLDLDCQAQQGVLPHMKLPCATSTVSVAPAAAELNVTCQSSALQPAELPTTTTSAESAIPELAVFNEPIAFSNQENAVAFGRPFLLPEDFFPPQSLEMSLEELSNLSELGSPEALGAPAQMPSSMLDFE